MSLAERLKAARKNAGLKQRQMFQKCGIDDSSLSSFENGHSEPRLSQLEALAKAYHVPLSYFFTEEMNLNQLVMWRNKPANNKEIEAEFINLCRQYRQFEIWTNAVTEKHLPDLDNHFERFDYPQVQTMATDARRILGLGDRPGESLYWILEEVYSIKIFYMDLGQEGIAACAVSDEFGKAILLNKNCTRWRRNHDLAHELFHILTWKRFDHCQGICEPTEQEEKFATCFAGNLLLPTDIVRPVIEESFDDENNIPFSSLDRISREFDVSLESLLWRLHFLYKCDEKVTKEYITMAREYVMSTKRERGFEPPLFPERYRSLAIKAFQNGEISLGRFAKFMRIKRMEAETYIIGKEPEYAGPAIPPS